jgi:hypothetical protein
LESFSHTSLTQKVGQGGPLVVSISKSKTEIYRPESVF